MDDRDEARAAAGHGFWSEPGGALVVMALFVMGGLAWAALLGAGRADAYPAAMEDEAPGTQRVWLVDGFNLLHAAVLSGKDRADWWRRPARERVLALAEGLPEAEGEVVVVFDGDDPGDDEPTRGVRQVFAPSADDWLVRRVKETPRGVAVAVVTADRRLAGRARHHGAEVVSPRDFAERCRGER